MQRTASLMAAAAASLLIGATRAVYPLYAPRGPALPDNRLPPRKDKGRAYRWVALNRRKPDNLTRMIVA